MNGASFYALASIDESSRAATRTAVQRLLIIAAGATLLALAASFWLARMITEPIGRLSASLKRMAAPAKWRPGCALTGSSLEIDDAHRHVQRPDHVGHGGRGSDAGRPTRERFARLRWRSTRAIRTRPDIPNA